MHNSAGALTALSLDRPILVPDNSVNRLLADEVGNGWVYRYSGELTPDILRETVTVVRADARSDRPDLSTREWSDAGRRHVAAYRRAIQIRRPR
jgi:hypothetical protein